MSFIVNESTGNPLKTSQILRGLCNGKKRINDKIPKKKKKKKKKKKEKKKRKNDTSKNLNIPQKVTQ